MFSRLPGTSLPDTAVVLWRISAISGGIVLAAVAVCAGFLWWPGRILTPLTLMLLAAVIINVGLEVTLLVKLRYRAYRYDAASDSFQLRTGYLFSRHLVVPAGQILYVDVEQGPLTRRLGLCKVNIGTLGSVHPLGPLRESQAREIVATYGSRQDQHAAQ